MRWRQDYYLFIIGAVAFTAATIRPSVDGRTWAGGSVHGAGDFGGQVCQRAGPPGAGW
jgi:hypothetical protein